MGLQASVTLNTVVYTPAGVNSSAVATWVNRAGGILAGFSKLTQRYKDPTTGVQTKIDFNLSIPVVAAVDSPFNPAGSLLRTNSAVLSVWVASGSTLAERTDLYLRIKDLIATTMVQDAVKDLNPAI